MTSALSIEIISDPVCPWCYIGARRLAAAIEMSSGISFELRWQPFQLNPDMPREGMDRQTYYDQKFGAVEAKQLLENIRAVGLDEGIAFDYQPNAKAPNTLMAHSLLYLAGGSGSLTQTEVAEKLFHAHHAASMDIGNIDVLVGIAAEAGLDEGGVRDALASGSLEADVKRLIDESVVRGVSGVPFFVINGQHGISGAQPAEMLADAFTQIAADAAAD